MNQCPPGPQAFHRGRFEFFSKICWDIRELMFAKSCSAVSTTPAKNLSSVSFTPAISPCHWFSVIAGVVDTGDKFIVDTGDQLSAVTMTPAINLSPVTRKRTPWRWGAAKDRRKLKGDISGLRSRPRPPMMSLEPQWKVASIHTHISWSEAPEAAKTK